MSASPAPPRHAADHLPKLVPRVRAKACSIGPLCATLCRATPGAGHFGVYLSHLCRSPSRCEDVTLNVSLRLRLPSNTFSST
ncbi:hypothetical protein NQZ68_036238 [Dissostichus eleginoides]|nr:hypothetical protein NQZ68_036238 [Dissostichus eleginoides]